LGPLEFPSFEAKPPASVSIGPQGAEDGQRPPARPSAGRRPPALGLRSTTCDPGLPPNATRLAPTRPENKTSESRPPGPGPRDPSAEEFENRGPAALEPNTSWKFITATLIVSGLTVPLRLFRPQRPCHRRGTFNAGQSAGGRRKKP